MSIPVTAHELVVDVGICWAWRRGRACGSRCGGYICVGGIRGERVSLSGFHPSLEAAGEDAGRGILVRARAGLPGVVALVVARAHVDDKLIRLPNRSVGSIIPIVIGRHLP